MFPTNIFDFGDVTLESATMKIDAFRGFFSPEKERVEESTRSHKSNKKISRFDNFQHIYLNIRHRNLSNDDFRRLSDLFAHLVFGGVILPPFIVGAGEFLQANPRKFSLYVVSATPEDEILQAVKEWGLGGFFRGVHNALMGKACLDVPGI